jgi:arsenate reductase (thioredoxin)
MAAAPIRVLFLCTGNSARSIIAESVLRKDGGNRFLGFSAGSRPKGHVNPTALEVLERAGYPTAGLRSKSWEEFAAPGAAIIDIVITVCDNAAGEACPIWPGHPMTVHWGIEDPAAVGGTETEQGAAFEQALRYVKLRLDRLIALPIDEMPAATLKSELQAIGRADGASRIAARTTGQ